MVNRKLGDANTTRSSVKGSGNRGVIVAGNDLQGILRGREREREDPRTYFNNIRQYMSYKIEWCWVRFSMRPDRRNAALRES